MTKIIQIPLTCDQLLYVLHGISISLLIYGTINLNKVRLCGTVNDLMVCDSIYAFIFMFGLLGVFYSTIITIWRKGDAISKYLIWFKCKCDKK